MNIKENYKSSLKEVNTLITSWNADTNINKMKLTVLISIDKHLKAIEEKL